MTNVDLAEFSVTLRRTYNAKKEDIFKAFQSAEALTQWFSPRPDIPVEFLEFAFRSQGKFRIRFTMADGMQLIVGGVYEKIAPPDELVFSWIWEEPDQHAGIATRVHVQFLEKGTNTEVLLTHDKLPTKEACERHALGWEGSLNRLDTALIKNKI